MKRWWVLFSFEFWITLMKHYWIHSRSMISIVIVQKMIVTKTSSVDARPRMSIISTIFDVTNMIKFVNSEKALNFCKIYTIDLTGTTLMSKKCWPICYCRFREFKTLFGYRSRAKHWFKNLTILVRYISPVIEFLLGGQT